jgi:hypothetical protein
LEKMKMTLQFLLLLGGLLTLFSPSLHAQGWYYNPFTRKLDFSGSTSGGASIARTAISGTTPVFPRTSSIQEWTVALTANITSSTATGLVAGDLLSYEFTQPAGGGITVVLPTGFTGANLINTAANSTTVLRYVWTGSAAIRYVDKSLGGSGPPGFIVESSGNFIQFVDFPATVMGFTGTIVGSRCVETNAAGNGLVSAGSACGSGSGGTAVGEWSSTIDFTNILDFSCVENTFTATGLTTGTPLLLVTPAAINALLIGRAWASAADTAKVQLCNTGGPDVDPASASFTVKAARGYLNAASTIDFASICAGCTLSNTITVTGATTAFGAVASPPAAFNAGLLVSASVTAANTVTIYVSNLTEADIDPASGSFTAMVFQ